ncbi:unnamed protein product [Coccothraustes coccothraustes]
MAERRADRARRHRGTRVSLNGDSRRGDRSEPPWPGLGNSLGSDRSAARRGGAGQGREERGGGPAVGAEAGAGTGVGVGVGVAARPVRLIDLTCKWYGGLKEEREGSL